MAELINKNLLVRTLRYLRSTESKKAPGVEIDTRTSTFKVALELLKDQGLVKNNGKISKKGIKYLDEIVYCPPFKVDMSNYGVVYDDNNVLVKKLKKILENRPAPDYKIDHQPLLPELTGMRAHYIATEENLHDKHIAMVGDYDSTGIGINLATKVGKMTVFDIDTRLIEFFNKTAKENNFPVKCVEQNIFDNPPKEFLGKCDVFVTDPPYAMGGMRKFIEFGIKLLKNGGVGYIAVPYHDSIAWTERMLYEVNKLVVDSGCVITDTYKNFHRYQTADGLRSSMIRIKKGSPSIKIDLDKMYSYKKRNVNAPVIKHYSI